MFTARGTRSQRLERVEAIANRLFEKVDPGFIGLITVDDDRCMNLHVHTDDAANNSRLVAILRTDNKFFELSRSTVLLLVDGMPYSLAHQAYPESMNDKSWEISLGTETVAKSPFHKEDGSREYFIQDLAASAEEFQSFYDRLVELSKAINATIPANLLEQLKAERERLYQKVDYMLEEHLQLASSDESFLIFRDSNFTGDPWNSISYDLDVQKFIVKIQENLGRQLNSQDVIVGRPAYSTATIVEQYKEGETFTSNVSIYFGSRIVGNSCTRSGEKFRESEYFFDGEPVTEPEFEKIVRTISDRTYLALREKGWVRKSYEVSENNC